MKETSMLVHSCEPKRRRLARDEAGVRMGFQAYIRFYETMQGSAETKHMMTFVTVLITEAFVKFGNYCVNTHVIAPARFMTGC
jgi:hypothetical protein